MATRVNYAAAYQQPAYKNLNPNFSGLTYNSNAGIPQQSTDNYATARSQFANRKEMDINKIESDIQKQRDLGAKVNPLGIASELGKTLSDTATKFKNTAEGTKALKTLSTAKNTLKTAKATGEGVQTAKTGLSAAKSGLKTALLSSPQALTALGGGVAGIAGNVVGNKLVAKGNEGAGYATKFAGTGASIGSMFGPLGMGIGAGVGAIAGAIHGAKEKKERLGEEKERAEEVDKYNKALEKSRYNTFTKARDLDRLANLQNRAATSMYMNGGILKTNLLPSLPKLETETKTPKFKRGGKLDVLKENVIIDGPSHDEENNTGVKGDKGLPVIDKGAKVAEIESMELVFNKNSTGEIERLTQEYKRTKNPEILEKLGELMHKELGENTYDYSKSLLA